MDCGDCDTVLHNQYYACATAANCVETVVPTAMQVPNPVTHFAADNNGIIIDLPTVAPTGAVTLSGQLIFGIDTQSDNQSGTQTVLALDGNAELLMTFNGQTLANSFIDSGSNGIYFADSITSIVRAPGVTRPSQIRGFLLSREYPDFGAWYPRHQRGHGE